MPIQEIGRYTISYMQILDEKGNVDKQLEPVISKEELMRLYRAMVLTREADKRMLNLQRQGRIGTFAPVTGMEGTHCAVTLAMHKNDWFVGAFRETGARLMLGETVAQTLDYFDGFEEGSRRPPNYDRILPINIIVGSQCLHAVGLGYAVKMKGEKDVAVVTYMGDGATSEGDIHEAMNFATVYQVPVVFICQNNQWAISVPRKFQTSSASIAQKAIAYEMPCIQVDGNDPLAVYRAADEAFNRARSGNGPTFIEAVTYRVMMHTTADDPHRYRTEEEEKEWWAKDPIPRFRTYLKRKKILTPKIQADMEAEIADTIEKSIKEFETPKTIKMDSAFDYVFSTKHPHIEEQRAEFLENLEWEAEHAKA